MATLKATVLLFVAMFGGATGAPMNKPAVSNVITVSGIVEKAKVVTAETSGYAIRLDKPVDIGIRKTCYLEICRGCPGLKPLLNKRVTAVCSITGKRGPECGGNRVIMLADVRELKAR